MNKNKINTLRYSVLMSVYYKEKAEYFKTSIESMLNQTITPNQIVIVADGKLTEQLYAVLNHYVSAYPAMFTIIYLKENIGLGRALNVGLKKCRNNLVARMDTDDISLPRRCEKQLKVFQKDREVSIVGTQIDEFYGSVNNIVYSRNVPTKPKEILEFSKRRSPFNHPTVMYKRDDVWNAGGYGSSGRKEDLELFGRMLHKGYKGRNINESLLLYRSNKDNLKRRKTWNNCRDYIVVIYHFYKKGYSTFEDFLFVAIGQLIMWVAPEWIVKVLTKKFLRVKLKQQGIKST